MRGLCSIAALSAVVALLPEVAGAAQWYSQPSVSIQGEFEDNIRLSNSGPKDVFGSVLTGRLKAGRHSEVTHFDFDGYFDLKQYTGDQDLDTNNLYLDLEAAHFTERNEFRLGGEVTLDSTLTSELETSGLTQTRKRRVKRTIAPSWSYLLTERTRVGLNYSFADVDYLKAGVTGLTDYSYEVMGGTLTRSWDPKTLLSASLTTSLYKAPDSFDTRTRDYSFNAGWERHFSETFSAGASLGVRHARTEFNVLGVDFKSNDTGALFGFNASRFFEHSDVTVTISRAVAPSGSGNLMKTDNLQLRFGHEISERMAFKLSARAFRNSSLDGRDSTLDRTYYSIEPKLRWRFSRWWLIEGFYRYRWQEYDISNRLADSNGFFIRMTYSWPSELPLR